MSTHHRGPGSVAAPTSGTDGPTGRRTPSRTFVVGGLALGLTTAALAGMPAQAIDSNPPTGPGNIEIFPKRDMVAIEGYGEYAGKTAEIAVLRNGAVVGSARGTVDGTGFLEVNHPGGVCWGAGTDLEVTPDIRGNDEIRVDFLDTGGRWDGARTTAVEITDVTRVAAGNQLVISGTYGPGVDMPGADLLTDPGKVGVEIVNPDMRGGTSAVGERAIGWPQEAGEPAPTGYTVTGGVTSGTDATGGTFEVTYAFEQVSDLDLAEAGEVVGLGWQSEAPAELGVEAFYGMTLYEYHEASGPGFGGCPAGPEEMRPSAPTEVTGKGVGDGQIHVTWGPGTAQPAAPPITGYSVTAVRSYDAVNGVTAGGLVRVNATARSATIEGLTPGEIYDVEVASRSTAGDSLPAVMRVRAAAHVQASAEARTDAPTNEAGQYTRPLVTNDNVDFGVYLDPAAGTGHGAQIYYTTDGSAPTKSGTPYQLGEPIDIRMDTTLRWIVFDGGNIEGATGSKAFDIEMADAPAAPAAPTAVAGDTSATVSFPLVTGGEAYRVQTYDGDLRVGAPLGVPLPTDGSTEATRRITGLTNGTAYTFTVAVRVGAAWSNESPKSEPVTPTGAPKAVAGPDQTVLRGRQFTLDASASVLASTYQWVQVRPTAANNGGLPQDPPVDLDPAVTGIQTTSTVPTLSATFPLLTTSTSDHDLRFRLTTTHPDGSTKTDTVDITGQPDTVTADEARWRQGRAIRLNGTGSQENATLRFLDASPTGRLLFTAVVTNGQWAAPEVNVTLSTGRIHVWSDYGYVGTIQTTR